jgi:uncharacterized membrane protein YhaH (DUF805 family)
MTVNHNKHAGSHSPPIRTGHEGGKFMEWMLLPLKRYADFTGRSRRMEYWMFQLGVIIAYVALLIVGVVLGAVSETLGGLVMSAGLIILALGAIIPSIAVGVRRLHDQDKSGWFMLLGLIPIVSLVLLVFMFLEGTRGPNQYGPDPKGSSGDIFS